MVICDIVWKNKMIMIKNRFGLLLVGLIVALSSHALSKDSLNAISMVSYEQGWLDSEGALSLKNNTKQSVENVAFRITYLDMKGRPMDFKDFFVKVDIPSGLTKKVEIEAYENSRHYSYYTSDACYPPHRFKIKFQLQGYNLPKKQMEQSDVSDSVEIADSYDSHDLDEENSTGTLITIMSIVLPLMFVLFYFGLYVVAAQMARSRHRNVAVWVLASFFVTPILVIIILCFIGNSEERPYM